jgi:hypothetical protein
MAYGSVKRSVDCAADYSKLQLSKMNSFIIQYSDKKRQIHVLDLIISKRNMTSKW